MVPGQIAYCHGMLKPDRQHLEARVDQLGCQEMAEVRGQIQLAKARLIAISQMLAMLPKASLSASIKPAPDPIRQTRLFCNCPKKDMRVQ